MPCCLCCTHHQSTTHTPAAAGAPLARPRQRAVVAWQRVPRVSAQHATHATHATRCACARAQQAGSGFCCCAHRRIPTRTEKRHPAAGPRRPRAHHATTLTQPQDAATAAVLAVQQGCVVVCYATVAFPLASAVALERDKENAEASEDHLWGPRRKLFSPFVHWKIHLGLCVCVCERERGVRFRLLVAWRWLAVGLWTTELER